MNLQTKWNEFVDEIADQVVSFNEKASEVLRAELKRDFPLTEELLVWAKSYVRFQHQAMAFVHTCMNQNRFQEAVLVSQCMTLLNGALVGEKGSSTLNEFCKEVNF